jgi:hypothetical protein
LNLDVGDIKFSVAFTMFENANVLRGEGFKYSRGYPRTGATRVKTREPPELTEGTANIADNAEWASTVTYFWLKLSVTTFDFHYYDINTNPPLLPALDLIKWNNCVYTKSDEGNEIIGNSSEVFNHLRNQPVFIPSNIVTALQAKESHQPED